MRWTEQQYADWARRCVESSAPSYAPFKLPANEAGAFALGRLPRGVMNKTERQYAAYLAEQMHLKQILWFKFEGIKLRLADNTFFTPDFFVMNADCRLECREVKGHWLDDARVKIKVAASIYPFRFIAVTKRAQKHGGGWDIEEFA